MTQGLLTPRRFSGGKVALDSIFGLEKYKDPKRVDQKSKSKENVKILLKYNSLDDAYPAFISFLSDPMARSHFKSYLHAKLSVENILFYESVLHFREVETKQSDTENAQLSRKIYREFFQPGPTDSTVYVLNVDGGMKRALSEVVKNTREHTSVIFRHALELVLQQMQTEWIYFKQTPQGKALLDNLNNNTYLVLPDPLSRAPVTLPAGWDASDDPVNWGLAVN